ncbi:TonB-dependent receptor domain-containing protein [Sphingomonas sp.]|uniref:TonB-dependent receptor domain-containing protein n=1 Tax=Sphingomonas sp. TaxID=28214 RepID=UPI003B0088D6
MSSIRLSTLLSTAPLAIALAGVSPAFAQTAATPQTPAAQDIQVQEETASAQGQSDQGADGDVVVTGSLLRRTSTETPSPVTVLTSENLSRAGITTAADAIRSISADSAGSIGTGFQTGFSAGGSAVSLRGLGVSSTLVLVDGLRSTNFPINDDGHNAYVDLNSIPFSLIDRIEVLKDGASSTYGADAIGGVVNLILKKTFVGVAGQVEGGIAERGDASRYRANLTAGIGDYEANGWNVYINGEYQRDGRVSNNSRGFPYNTQDLRAIGGNDNNTADSGLTVNTPTAYVVRTTQTDLNNPLTGGTAPIADGTYVDATGKTQPYSNYSTLGLSNCARPTYTVTTGGARGVGCPYDLTDLYRQIQPLQERYSFNGRVSVRINDEIEAYATGSFSRSYVSITSAFPSGVRQTQPFGGSPLVASSNPGIVLPVYVCAAGINCATAADRQLNPNNPYAAANALTPNQGAARIYYLFGDIAGGSERTNDVYRGTAGLTGRFGDKVNWRVEGVYARDNLEITQHGLLNIVALRQVINTGAYNFVNPAANTQAVRDFLAPDKTTPSHSELYSIDASIAAELAQLAGGPLQLAVGGQARREKLENNNQNAALDTYALTTSSAFGAHTVVAGYAELDAPLLTSLDLNLSGRYDHYSEGYGRFSPKIGVKFTPIRQFAIRGTYSQGFRAPTFAEAGPRSQYAGFVTITPPAGFVTQHGGAAAGNPYNFQYSVGRGFAGNPNLEPERSRSFTLGGIFQPVRWFSATVDYYNVKKTNLIANGPLAGAAINAYYSVAGNAYPSAAAASAAGCAAVAAVGAGYSCNLIDGVDPLFPNALPRVLIVNAPFVNVNSDTTEGLDFSATLNAPIFGGAKFTSRVEATYIIRYDRDTANGVQRFAGSFGPYDLSSGNGTPRVRGNWQNTLDFGSYAISATTYYVGRIKEVATDQGNLSTACTANLYKVAASAPGYNAFCYVNSFINVDLNQTFRVNDKFSFTFNVLNLLDARAPVAPAAYASAPNFLTTWHYAGLIGRQFRAGAAFRF